MDRARGTLDGHRRLFQAETCVLLRKRPFLLRLCKQMLRTVVGCSSAPKVKLGTSLFPGLINTGLSLGNWSVEERYLTFFNSRSYNWWPVVWLDMTKWGKRFGSWLMFRLDKLACSSKTPSQVISGISVFRRQTSVVLRKHLAPWELLNIVSVCTCVCT